jgi:hypothetical protein
MRALKLPLQFDTERLLRDLENVAAGSAWQAHHRPDHSTDWHAIALRSINGDPNNTKYHKDPAVFRDTPTYSRCSYIPEIIKTLACPMRRIRFLRLLPGARIKRHMDGTETLLHGEARLHIPIITDPGVQFFIGGERVVMKPGELWYLNAIHRHWLYNPTQTSRVHLVLDCVVNDRIWKLIWESATPFNRLTERLMYTLRPILIQRDTALQYGARQMERLLGLK